LGTPGVLHVNFYFFIFYLALKITTSRTQSWAIAFALLLKAASAAKLLIFKNNLLLTPKCKRQLIKHNISI
jgi:hypothetical protein